MAEPGLAGVLIQPQTRRALAAQLCGWNCVRKSRGV
eukprot:CAMPEP_0182811272 /NCGR_PEP_ID=MMETSP0006_2-20121128/8182_1 /TAXON_ID=97485 /ORGANISM="Prymnesium parvum, Strain Texoma1" /LENGTH=35 /DNA_ID= /DNA_START= /DNA_END= /DNA_ORIENTATION=